MAKISKEFFFAGTNFRVRATGREKRENLNLAKITHYTVYFVLLQTETSIPDPAWTPTRPESLQQVYII